MLHKYTVIGNQAFAFCIYMDPKYSINGVCCSLSLKASRCGHNYLVTVVMFSGVGVISHERLPFRVLYIYLVTIIYSTNYCRTNSEIRMQASLRQLRKTVWTKTHSVWYFTDVWLNRPWHWPILRPFTV